MTSTDYVGCVIKTVGLIALTASDFASFAIVLFIFWAYVWLPKIVRDFRSS